MYILFVLIFFSLLITCLDALPVLRTSPGSRGHVEHILEILKMETILVKISTVQDTVINVSPAVKIKNYILSLAGPLSTLCESYDSESIVQIFRQFKFQAVNPNDSDSQSVEVHCIAVYNCDFISSTLEQDFYDIRLGNQSDITLPSTDFGLFLLFSSNKNANVTEGVHDFFDKLLPLNRKMIGSPVIVVSTPFQNLFLFNAHSGGIICNVFGRNQCLFLTDVKLSSGCEGAPVFSIYGDLIGAVINVFTWCKGEWVGFSLAVHLYPVLKSWLIALKENAVSIKREISVDQYSFVEDIDSYGVVLISGRGIWGSGIILDKSLGLIVTCSHVVSYSTRTDILVEFKRKKYNAEVLYATVQNSPFDLAVVRVRSSNFKDVKEFKIPTSPVTKGEPVYMIGYPLFSFKNHTIQGPSVTYGHIANIYDEAMIVAACVSNSGSSGGALMRRNGELIGVTSNNITAREILVPHITVVIPTSVFVQPIKKFSQTQDVDDLKCLTSRDQNVLRIWRLESKCKL